ncbi:hypothetical protein SynBIOSU31_02635 [Synechococcus sp. BIOS-U3-1]|nr:hypothetical protein SynBIOSU31_02635 [Synechococcus sp. BIOS-U3-1]
MQLMQCDELQATGTTSGKVLLDVVAILCGQIRLLKAVDVSCDFIVHRDACFEQNGDFEKHAGFSSRPSFFAPKSCFWRNKSVGPAGRKTSKSLRCSRSEHKWANYWARWCLPES